jgi:Transposase DDE domain
VYGSCTQLREHFEAEGQAYVLRVPSNFMITVTTGTKLTCAQAVSRLLKHKRRWEVRSAGHGSKGERWYAWAWIATASPRHHLLVRRHLRTGELAFHYCWVPDGQLLTKTRLIRAAALRWPVEEDFSFSKDCFGLDQCQARLVRAVDGILGTHRVKWHSAELDHDPLHSAGPSGWAGCAISALGV